MGEACHQITHIAECLPTLQSVNNPYSHCFWYALKVRVGGEQAVTAALRDRGFAPFSPTQKERRQYSDRIKIVDGAVFPGYLFCQFDIERSLQIISTPGVEYIVSFGGQAVPVPEQDLLNIKRMIAAGALTSQGVVCGQKVRITDGTLAGVEGTLVRDSTGNRLVVSVALLNRSAFLHIEETRVCSVA